MIKSLMDTAGKCAPLPFPTPLLHPRAVEALLLAFAPVDEKE